jgi:hypothetical protein
MANPEHGKSKTNTRKIAFIVRFAHILSIARTPENFTYSRWRILEAILCPIIRGYIQIPVIKTENQTVQRHHVS